jgi:hypothetical protein
MKRFPSRYLIPFELDKLSPLGLPMSDRLAVVLQDFGIRTFGDLSKLSLEHLEDLGDEDGSLAMELGRLIRRATRENLQTRTTSLCELLGGTPAPFWWSGDMRGDPAHDATEAPDQFVIPQRLRLLPLRRVPLNRRARAVLGFAGLALLGGLHRVTFVQLLSIEGFGPKSLAELRRVVSGLISATVEPVPPKHYEEGKEGKRRSFSVPPTIHNLSPYTFALSRRLRGALRRAGVSVFGELEEIEPGDILVMANCSKGTLLELQQTMQIAKLLAAN